MHGLFWMAAVAVLALVGAFAVPIRVGLRFGHAGLLGPMRVTVHAGRPRLFSFAVPSPLSLGRRSKNQKTPMSKRRAWAVQAATRRIERFEWRTFCGVGDAALTSWAAGLLWGAKSSLVGVLSQRHEFMAKPKLDVIPDFDRTLLRTELSCIFRFTLGEVIVAALVGLNRAKRG